MYRLSTPAGVGRQAKQGWGVLFVQDASLSLIKSLRVSGAMRGAICIFAT
jgi:hypothetical protein